LLLQHDGHDALSGLQAAGFGVAAPPLRSSLVLSPGAAGFTGKVPGSLAHAPRPSAAALAPGAQLGALQQGQHGQQLQPSCPNQPYLHQHLYSMDL
jgi:hypothetical protein